MRSKKCCRDQESGTLASSTAWWVGALFEGCTKLVGTKLDVQARVLHVSKGVELEIITFSKTLNIFSARALQRKEIYIQRSVRASRDIEVVHQSCTHDPITSKLCSTIFVRLEDARLRI